MDLDIWITCCDLERPRIVWMYRNAYRDLEVLELTEYLDISMLWVRCFFFFYISFYLLLAALNVLLCTLLHS